MKTSLRKIVDHRDENTLAASFRRKRFEIFLNLIAPLQRPVHILDVGGEQKFWEVMGFGDDPDYQITLLNIYKPEVTRANFNGLVGDATNMIEIPDQEFNCVFSNSVIEHVGSYVNQQRMAQEIQRVGNFYFVQTPNKFFPLEPHFLIPFFQFYPQRLQIYLSQHFNLGWYQKIPDFEEARAHVQSHRLLTFSEMCTLFPKGQIYNEKAFGMTKSFIAYGSSS
jgi:hypothetical protein